MARIYNEVVAFRVTRREARRLEAIAMLEGRTRGELLRRYTVKALDEQLERVGLIDRTEPT